MICAIAIVIKNMWLNFGKVRLNSFGDFINKPSKNVIPRKTRLKFSVAKNREKILLTSNQRCLHHTLCLHLLHSAHFHPK